MTHVLFLYYMEPELEKHWNDGLRAALRVIDNKRNFKVTLHNLYQNGYVGGLFDFILGWGGFNSPVDLFIQRQKFEVPIGLCIGGNAFPPRQDNTYDVLFYETHWYEPKVSWHHNTIRAFGINDHIFKDFSDYDNPDFSEFLFDYISIGSFSNWKRHDKILDKEGNRLVIGQIQRNNMQESGSIIGQLLNGGVAISDMVDPEKLAIIYNLTETVYIPAELNGGGERALWEAISCGCKVEIEDDNPKLKSLLKEKPTNHHWYASAILKGIKSCLN